MKLTFIIGSLGGGGAEKVLVSLANYFSQAGTHSVTVITLPNELPIINQPCKQVKHIALEPPNNYSSLRKKIAYHLHLIRNIKKEIKKNDSDLVVSFITYTNIISILACKIAKKPIIISERTAYNKGPSNKFWGMMRRLFYPFSDALVITTNEDIPKYNYVENRYQINNPMQLKHENTVKRKKIILAVGRLNPVKGYDMLINAFSNIKNKEDWKLLIAGEGSERNALEQLINKLQLNNDVSLLGQISDLEYYYKQASIFVLSSRTEGFPNALCEAMGYGCACIAFDCPTGPKEIITDSVNGILVEAGNIQDLSTSMQALMFEPETRKLIGDNAKNITKKLNISDISRQWLEIATPIVNGRKQ